MGLVMGMQMSCNGITRVIWMEEELELLWVKGSIFLQLFGHQLLID